MTYQEFRNLVASMRIAQKLYFQRRDQAVLTESKRLEHEVDKALREYDEGQGKLFQEPGK